MKIKTLAILLVLYGFVEAKTIYLDVDKITPVVRDFSVFIVEKGSKYGFLDINGTNLTPLEYTTLIKIGYKNSFLAGKEGKYGVLKPNADVIIPMVYDTVNSYAQNYYRVRKDKKIGIFDENGTNIVPVKYEKVSATQNGFVVQDGFYMGLFDENGTQIIPIQYENIKNLSKKFAFVRLNGKWRLYDKKSAKLKDQVFDMVNESKNVPYAQVMKDGNYSIVSKQTGEVISGYKNPTNSNKNLISVQKGSKYGLIDKSGKVVVPAVYDSRIYFYGEFANVKKDGKSVRISKSSKEVSSLKNREIYYRNDIFEVYKENGKYGVLNKKGEVLFPFIYDNFGYGLKQYMVLKKKSLWLLVDAKNKKVLKKFKYKPLLQDCNCNKLYIAYKDKNGKYGLLDEKLNVIFKPKYESLNIWTTASFTFGKNKKLGIIDMNEKVLVEPKFDKLQWLGCNNGIYMATTKDKWQLFNINNEPLGKIYNNTSIGQYGKYFQVYKKKKTGLLSLQGEEILPIEYDSIRSIDDNIYVAQKSDSISFFNKNETIYSVTYNKQERVDYDGNKDFIWIQKKDDFLLVDTHTKEIILKKRDNNASK